MFTRLWIFKLGVHINLVRIHIHRIEAQATTGKSRASGVVRDKHGKIKRSSSAKNSFKKSHPCPATGNTSGSCKGYVIDHVKAIKHGGKDDPSNMQWQSREAAKAKDMVE